MEKFETLLFITDGFEEVEAVMTIDILRRAGISIAAVSLTGDEIVTGSHNISIKADAIFENIDLEDSKMLILPGGPGHMKLKTHQGLIDLLKRYHTENKYLAAICAAPSVLGGLNVLEGKKAVCYPSFEDKLTGAEVLYDAVMKDGNIITSRGPGTAALFALKIVETLRGAELAAKIKDDFLL